MKVASSASSSSLLWLFWLIGSSTSLWLPVSDAQITPPSTPNVQPVNYTHEGDLLQGYVSYPSWANEAGATGPAIVFVPDWDGVNEYEQLRATMAAINPGYVGFAADIYGIDLHYVNDTDERMELATFWRSNSTLFASRIQAAIDLVRTFPQVNPDQVALAGYCFGGSGVLSYALLGLNDVPAIISYHGGLTNLPVAGVAVTPQLLVLSGGSDDTSTDVMNLESTLNSVNASWEITRYSNVQHAFTVYGDERYNEWADYRSWISTITFLSEIFQPGNMMFDPSPPDAVAVDAVPYTDVDGTQLQGYVAFPNQEWVAPYPAVVILPDWDGVNQYEQLRATKLAELGYVGFAADIYGADLQTDLDMDTRANLTTTYRSNMTLFVQRIERAIRQVTSYDNVDPNNVAVIGYCFGGTGVIDLAFSGNTDVKVVVSLHGGLTDLPNTTNVVDPYTLILSGGDDDAHGNQTELEAALNGANATWEITRYSFVQHGYTEWDGDAYDARADSRSWESMLMVLMDRMDAPVRQAPSSNNSDPPSETPSMVPTSRGPSGTMSPSSMDAETNSPSSVPSITPVNVRPPSTPTTASVPTASVPTTTTSGGSIASYNGNWPVSAALSVVIVAATTTTIWAL